MSERFPRFWMYETSGTLRPVIVAYLEGETLNEKQIATMRVYLRQWIEATCWRGEVVDNLRGRIDQLTSREAIDAWLHDALEVCIDPL